jgi:tRNA wybutosine-synthesizing protein 4
VSGVLVFGGKTSDGGILDECSFWAPNHGWQKLAVSGDRPPPRFGAAICSLETDERGVLLGGISSDGTVLDDIWEYLISAAPQPSISFRERTRDVDATQARSTYARFGASLVPFGDALLLVGGVSNKAILNLSEEFLVISTGAKIHVETPKVSLPKDAWPLLVGAGVTAVSDHEVMIIGGGAVCFSMGSFWNEGYLTVRSGQAGDSALWTVSTVEAVEQSETSEKTSPKHASKAKSMGKKGTSHRKKSEVPRIQINSAEDFTALVQASKPAIIEGLNLGPCTELWTLDYLKEKLGVEREIVIHECSSDRMTFKDKNFQYVKKSVGEFLDGISSGAQTYLRAVSASQPNKLPTKLEDDFPTIAADFQLPAELSIIKETYHSSPLRISGPVSLWLHYDVLANVLCQIKGTKTLHLYPPSDVKYLDYPPGGSSSNTNVLDISSKDAQRLRHTHPHIASLRPGDVLFIPPMWSHTATPEDGHSLAVNVFFRNLEKGYAAGKDVYGNRDLQAYENGRRDVDKIVRAFKDLPKDVSKFYLDRLIAELQKSAEAAVRKK